MTKSYLTNITADSFSGEVFAFEGIDNVVTLINGPTGCKFYHSATSANQTIKQAELDPLAFPEQWYFGQPRIPCTYLDTKDYVYGSEAKIIEAITYFEKNLDYDLLCIVNSVGAALIGDNIKDIATRYTNKPTIVVESPGYSQDISDGYSNAFINMFNQLPLNNIKAMPKTINIIGLSIYHKYYLGDIEELKKLFGLCDIKINCFLGAECSLETIKNMPQASLNVVINSEFGLEIAQKLEKQYNIPYYECDGLPIGFNATTKMLEDVATILNASTDKVKEVEEKARVQAYVYISRVNAITGLPQAIPYALEGYYSQVYSYARFISNYFGMYLEGLSILADQKELYKDRLETLLTTINSTEALNMDIENTNGDIVFGSGNLIARLKILKKEFCGIEINQPSLGYIDVIPKTHLGYQGALLIVEQILNGLIF